MRPHSHASPVLLARGQEVLLPYKNISLAYAIVFQKSRSDVSLSSCATMKIPSREGKEGFTLQGWVLAVWNNPPLQS